MASQNPALLSLNAGEISKHALARIDLAKLRVACEQQENFLPLVLGPCMVRPGTRYLDTTASNAAGKMVEFYYDENTKALPVLTSGAMRVMVNDAYISRVAVSSAVTNGDFDTDVTGWTDSDESGCTSQWATGGLLSLAGTDTNYAFRDQQVTVAAPDQNVEHALRLAVNHGYVAIQVGVSAGDGTYWDLTDLPPGNYSLAFTPAGDFWIRLGAKTIYPSYVDSIEVEGAGTLSLPTPWTSTTHFNTLRYDQSGDVIFCACAGLQQRRIERRASDSRSWAVALYQADDGPFRVGNVTDSVQLTPSATTGSIAVTSSRPLFKSTQVGALFKITHPSQTATGALSALNATTSTEIRVSGLASHNFSASSRAFTVVIEGTFVATITLQRSIGAPGSWTDVESYTAPTSKTFDDGLDNQIIYYRLKCTAYTSGTANATLFYAASSQTGIVRIQAFTNTQTVTADVLETLGGTTATSDWAEGEWSDYRGWPAAVALHDGRLSWHTGIKAQLSVSDAFASFDDTIEGDSGPINKTIATGGNDGIRWALSLQRLILGTAAQEISVRSSAFDEPLTPTAFVARDCSTRGAAKVRAVKVDTIGVFVERNAKRVFELAFDLQAGDYKSRELTRLKQEMCDAGVVDLAVQRQPDTRLWFVLGDGTCAVLTYDQEDDVVAWTPVTTDGLYERVAVLPGTDEDDVYFIVNRTVGGTKRYVEKLAKRSECVGGTLSKTIDAHIVYSGSPATTITGLSHLEGKQVVVWGDGAPRVTADAPATVTGGQITGLPVAVSNAVVGLAFTAQLKTAKLAYGAEHGTALTLPKRIAGVGLVMADTCVEGVKVGRDFSNLRRLATTFDGKALTPGQVVEAFDVRPSCFNGGWGSDSRVCVQVRAPYPATLMALTLHEATSEPQDALPPPRREAA